MNKSLHLIISTLTLVLTALADDTASAENTHAPIIALASTEPKCYDITLKGGVMHTSVGYWDKDSSQNVPSLLYGCTLGFRWDFMKMWGLTHTLGFSAGIYNGTNTADWDDGPYVNRDTGEWSTISLRIDRLTAEVWTFPLTVSYDLKKDISDALSVYAGVRTGAMVRRTIVDGFYGGINASMAEVRYSDVSSTKIIPMLGFGTGIQMYMSDTWSFCLSYDFVWTLGNDCSRLRANSGSEDYEKWAPKATSDNKRYYGMVSFGVTYTF